ncbi:hypothetical protein [Methanoculleus sp.]|jgi:hypothetical protein|uniref:hypothetical protein n=1 Tax=Methanoculleus sp. TaxID=90427 RepID=UPI001BD2F021|nr:hypothetical protein [Methanoculleus sp.]
MDGYARHIHDQLVHYMTAQPFFEYFNNYLIVGREEWCPFKHEGEAVNCQCYSTNPAIGTLLAMLDKYLLCNRFLDANPYFLDEYVKTTNLLHHPETIRSFEHFNELISELSDIIEILDKNVQEKLSRVICQEAIRLDESLVSYSNHCKYSSIILAVSAVEFRLHRMIRNFDSEQYEQKFRNHTLGAIINLFVADKADKDIKQLLDARYIPLIQLLNTYRILTVHPKDLERPEGIPQGIVDSIVSLSFAFLTDPGNTAYTADELKCGR